MLWFPQLNSSDYDRIRQPAESSRVAQYNHEICRKKPETRPPPFYFPLHRPVGATMARLLIWVQSLNHNENHAA